MIRYPGSKSKLLDAIVKTFPHRLTLALWANNVGWEYREPFFGSGAVGLDVMDALPASCSAWLNDKDYWLVCMWNAIKREPRQLCSLIESFEPSAEKFYQFKESDGNRIDPTTAGFRKIALHQMSFGGFGVKAGGPLGGKDGGSEYNPDSRWNPEALMLKVTRFHKLLNARDTRITCFDFSKLFDGDKSCFVYADPPYVVKGPELYKHSFDDADHRRLAAAASCSDCQIAISYDDHPLVRQLYAGWRIVTIEVRYSCAIEKVARRKNQEILITNVPDEMRKQPNETGQLVEAK